MTQPCQRHAIELNLYFFAKILRFLIRFCHQLIRCRGFFKGIQEIERIKKVIAFISQ